MIVREKEFALTVVHAALVTPRTIPVYNVLETKTLDHIDDTRTTNNCSRLYRVLSHESQSRLTSLTKANNGGGEATLTLFSR